MAKMKASDFVAMAKKIAKSYKTLYVLGCFGAPMTAKNKARYTKNQAYNRQASRTKMINAASADTFGFDCVCLVKGILWGWDGDKNATYGGAKYCSNGVPDMGSDGIMYYCTSRSTSFKKIEVGEILHKSGHVGIYIGDGLAVECTPKWKNGVQITAVANIGKKSGYNARTWENHGKLKYIDYTAQKAEEPKKEDPKETASYYTVVKGDTMSKIAKAHGLTLAKLKKLNPQITNVNLIHVGDKVRIK